jgi:hypothetical protein
MAQAIGDVFDSIHEMADPADAQKDYRTQSIRKCKDLPATTAMPLMALMAQETI